MSTPKPKFVHIKKRTNPGDNPRTIYDLVIPVGCGRAAAEMLRSKMERAFIALHDGDVLVSAASQVSGEAK